MKKVLIFVIVILLVIASSIVFISKGKSSQTDQKEEIVTANETETQVNIEEERQSEIFKGDARPIAVMIDNVGDARPQIGLNKAYIVYEIIVEGKFTRMMALFKNEKLDKIGPVRSSRHYFLDYALENDAIYTHFGCSPIAESDIASLKINNIDGMKESSKSFWRIRDKAAPHNVVTSTEKILQIAKRKGYRTTSEQKSILNYTTNEINLLDGIAANSVTIPYSSTYTVTYKYDDSTKRYTRAYNETSQKDFYTKDLVTTKNIIITFAKNSVIEEYKEADLQDLSHIGTLNGYYITNGKAIKITCYKASRSAQTVYKDLNGNEIKVNDGNTFIQIVPIDSNVVIK